MKVATNEIINPDYADDAPCITYACIRDTREAAIFLGSEGFIVVETELQGEDEEGQDEIPVETYNETFDTQSGALKALAVRILMNI